jgi:hypothetical protein
VTDAVAVRVHPLLSETVTRCTPAGNAVAVLPVCPFDQIKLYKALPPLAATVAAPADDPKQKLLVCVLMLADKAVEGPLIVTDAIEFTVQPLASVTVTL